MTTLVGKSAVPPTEQPTTELPTGGGVRATAMSVAGAVLLLIISAVHLTQGTSGIALGDLLGYLTHTGDESARAQIGAVLLGSRLPRLATGILFGVILGISGAAMQSLARNPLASPDTLAVNAGAQFAVIGVAALGISLPWLPSGSVPFLGGLAAAAVVVLMGGSGSTTRLVLAGTALAIALSAVTSTLQILFQRETSGLFAWGNGSLLQIDLLTVRQMLPVIAVAVAVLMLLAGRMDLLSLGDDTATLLGVHVARLRVIVLIVAVLLATTAVTLAGPIGFVGLFAPATVRLLARRAPMLARHRVLYPAAGLVGAIVVIGADMLLRLLFGSVAGVNIPTGVVTTVMGATLLIVLARRATGPRTASSSGSVATTSRRRFIIVVVGVAVAAVAGLLVAILVGGRLVLLGDLGNWFAGVAGPELAAP